jgi:hypothetical protein
MTMPPEGFDLTFDVSPIGTGRACPVCGGYPADLVGEALVVAGEALPACSSSTCPAWATVAKYDHEAGRWLPLDQDGRAPDGRHESEIR